MTIVSHATHTPLPMLYDMEVDELFKWADVALGTLNRLYGHGRT